MCTGIMLEVSAQAHQVVNPIRSSHPSRVLLATNAPDRPEESAGGQRGTGRDGPDARPDVT
jgi:hypothetical protein